MATRAELSDFLAGAERRAFKQAMYAVRDEDSALDIVQDAMIRLTEHYGDRPVRELGMLFTRILQNAIHDHFRRQKVRSTWMTLFSSFGAADDEDADTAELVSNAASAEASQPGADEEARRAQTIGIIEEELSRLPARQREAFLLRYWEDMDVAETASVMKCSEGSVKTHCSRATQALAKVLRAKGLEP